jgi:glucosamine-6-phosphate deaminase
MDFTVSSIVEQNALNRSKQKLVYAPTEKIGVIVVDNFPTLGKLSALRFIEWVQQNPGGVISLPTGKTPEHFIKWVTHFKNNWNKPEVQKQLEEEGINTSIIPDFQSLHFVQIDEFYPIRAQHHNSFMHYVTKFYIEGFGLNQNNALLMDCDKIGLPKDLDLDTVWPIQVVDLSLRYRHGKNSLERLQKQILENVDEWCVDYERKVRNLGGIGFFMGGIGPDGHIGFNVQGSDFYSTTRLTSTNYETQATAAGDLGGIEVSRNRLVITIGLETITYNPKCTAIIIAAGESKAKVVADSIQNTKHIHYPATCLQVLKNSRFYLTKGAALNLVERQFEALTNFDSISDQLVEKYVVDLANEKKKRIVNLTIDDYKSNRFSSFVLSKRGEDHNVLNKLVSESLITKFENGTKIKSGKTFLHTEPHHDDLMLGYLPAIVRNTRDASNTHYFVTLTSGFNAVTNQHVLNLLTKLQSFLERGLFDKFLNQNYFDPNNTHSRNRDTWQYLDGVAGNKQSLKDEGEARRFLSILFYIFEDDNVENLRNRIIELQNYFQTQYPGKKDLPHIQKLKGMIREWEADCLWGYFGFNASSVMHMRLGFYKGEIFTEDPTVNRDVMPFLDVLRKIKPDIVSVALDPEASGPDTHYKVLQVIAEALKLYKDETGRDDIEVWGYRNVWFRFHPSEANIFIPASLNMFATLESAFMNAFNSQKGASFPSYEHDGPFSELAQQIQVEQYQLLKGCLGREFFYENASPLYRATRGTVYLKSMSMNEFFDLSASLKKSTENL